MQLIDVEYICNVSILFIFHKSWAERQFEYLRVELDPWGFPAWQQPFFFVLSGRRMHYSCNSCPLSIEAESFRTVQSSHKRGNEFFEKSFYFVSLYCLVSFRGDLGRHFNLTFSSWCSLGVVCRRKCGISLDKI